MFFSVVSRNGEILTLLYRSRCYALFIPFFFTYIFVFFFAKHFPFFYFILHIFFNLFPRYFLLLLFCLFFKCDHSSSNSTYIFPLMYYAITLSLHILIFFPPLYIMYYFISDDTFLMIFLSNLTLSRKKKINPKEKLFIVIFRIVATLQVVIIHKCLFK